MNDILLIRDRSTSPSRKALLEQQAILAITRSIIAAFSTEEMKASEYKILIPAHLDILPLLTFVANDYTEITEPEAHKEGRSASFILYNDGDKEYEEYPELMKTLIQPNWFDDRYRELDLEKIVTVLKPRFCIAVGEGTQQLNILQNMRYRFQRALGFSVFSSGSAMNELADSRDFSFTMADNVFESTMYRTMFEMGRKTMGEFSLWSGFYNEEEASEYLERFIHFGAATEMALLSDEYQ